MILPPKNIFSIHQNKAEFKNLDYSEVPSYDFCVSSTSFQKSNVGWPQQPPTEKLLKFNLIFHDSTKNNFFKTSK